MNQVVTIPRRIAQKGDLVVLPRQEYEDMRRSLKEQEHVIQKKILDAHIEESLAEIRAGKCYGPFDSAGKAVAFLRSHRHKKR